MTARPQLPQGMEQELSSRLVARWQAAWSAGAPGGNSPLHLRSHKDGRVVDAAAVAALAVTAVTHGAATTHRAAAAGRPAATAVDLVAVVLVVGYPVDMFESFV